MKTEKRLIREDTGEKRLRDREGPGPRRVFLRLACLRKFERKNILTSAGIRCVKGRERTVVSAEKKGEDVEGRKTGGDVQMGDYYYNQVGSSAGRIENLQQELSSRKSTKGLKINVVIRYFT